MVKKVDVKGLNDFISDFIYHCIGMMSTYGKLKEESDFPSLFLSLDNGEQIGIDLEMSAGSHDIKPLIKDGIPVWVQVLQIAQEAHTQDKTPWISCTNLSIAIGSLQSLVDPEKVDVDSKISSDIAQSIIALKNASPAETKPKGIEVLQFEMFNGTTERLPFVARVLRGCADTKVGEIMELQDFCMSLKPEELIDLENLKGE